MATYWSILEKLPGSKLKLTKIDDDIFEHFQKDFPDLDVSQTIDEDNMKGKEGKERWRKFIMAYEKKIDDYNFGTMLRNSPQAEYTEKDTIFGSLPNSFTNPAEQLTSLKLCVCNSTLLRLQGKLDPGSRIDQYAHSLRNRAGLNDWIYVKQQVVEQGK